jgi:hypothetical protein
MLVVEMDDGELERQIVRKIPEYDRGAIVYYYKAAPRQLGGSGTWSESNVVRKCRDAVFMVASTFMDDEEDAKLLTRYGMVDTYATTIRAKIYSAHRLFLDFNDQTMQEFKELVSDAPDAKCYFDALKTYVQQEEEGGMDVEVDKNMLDRIRRKSSLVVDALFSIIDIAFRPIEQMVGKERFKDFFVLELADISEPYYETVLRQLADLLPIQAYFLHYGVQERQLVLDPDTKMLLLTRRKVGSEFLRTYSFHKATVLASTDGFSPDVILEKIDEFLGPRTARTRIGKGEETKDWSRWLV